MDEMENVEFIPDDETESDLSEEIPEAEPETEPETESESESEAENSEQDPEEPAEEIEQDEYLQDSEEEHDNTITVSGNVIILPDSYKPVEMQSESKAYASEDITAIIESLDYQTDIIRGGIVGLVFFLGLIAGILFVHGFRLRRV